MSQHTTEQSNSEAGTITDLLIAWGDGDQDAFARLVPRIYDELRQLAGSRLRGESFNDTLQVTGLVHETYLRLIGQNRIHWKNRAQFFGVAARQMRRILIDRARRRHAARRDHGLQRVSLDAALDLSDQRAPELLALEEALSALEVVDSELSQIVELRFFAGLSNVEIAQALQISEAKLARRWRVAKGWLYQRLTGGCASEVQKREA